MTSNFFSIKPNKIVYKITNIIENLLLFIIFFFILILLNSKIKSKDILSIEVDTII